MSADIKQWVKEGECCQVANDHPPAASSFMGGLLASRLNEIAAMDFALLEPPWNGPENVLVITAAVSNFTVCILTRDQWAATVAQVLLTEWFFKFGVPSQIHSNQGRSFEKSSACLGSPNNTQAHIIPPAMGSASGFMEHFTSFCAPFQPHGSGTGFPVFNR